jgi:hypothetical protein
MVVDLAAIFVLIIIACSGFFVAFTMAFTDDYDASAVAYALFQIFLGFTPAAWNVWPRYNLLGRAILTLFLFICHFLIVTILITVLTNSFMAIVSNANEEHQFVFAINTISMVKSDALFSYVAPGNILSWFLTPLRFLISFRQFVKLNRYVIKATHLPLLLSIYTYEKLFLARRVFNPTDLVENHGRERKRAVSFMDPDRVGIFSPSIRIRQESESGYQKDQALDDVFRLAPRQSLRSSTKGRERRQTSNIVTNWIEQHDGIASSPPEQDHSIVERLERKREASRRQGLVRRDRRNRRLSGTRSVGSGPISVTRDFAYPRLSKEQTALATGGHTEDDGDDELLTNEEVENASLDKASRGGDSNAVEDDDEDYFQTPTATRFPTAIPSSEDLTRRPHFSPITSSSAQQSSPKPLPARPGHARNLSSNTILYNPVSPSRNNSPKKISISMPKLLPQEKATQPTASGLITPSKRGIFPGSKFRPVNSTAQSSPNRASTSCFGPDLRSSRPLRHRRSSLDMGGFDLNSDASPLEPDLNHIGAVPSSFATQMALATGLVKPSGDGGGSTDRMMGRLMLARMKTLEEGFQEVLKEVKEIRAASTGANSPVGTAESRESKKCKAKGKGKSVLRKRERPISVEGGVEGEVQVVTPETETGMIGDLLGKGSPI